MSLPRIFVSSPLKSGQKISLEAAASCHVLQALRLQVGSPLIIFNSVSGGEFQATVTAIDKRRATVTLGDFIERHNESLLQIHLGQGVSRGEKMDFTIQKAVELGVNAISPLFTEYCNVHLEGERLKRRLDHWQNVAISATEQSGRCYVPQILFQSNLAKWFGSQVLGLRLILDPRATTKFSDIKEEPSCVTILVGPEGGFSDKEVEDAKQNQFLPVSLGPRVLRTETAALAAISLIQSRWGDF
ncbi:MAG: 16S rRNA (uracil(1498)-N(3))-methyltransferase [Gammaproteobacteria bacterium]|nr:16S rRNA (uracil(1498)-N(3))-methyltransferase [Gammaproteobacteria bacterium]